MRPQIVLFGDSITEQSFRSGGWGASLADSYSRKADIVIRGYGGYNTRWALFLLHHLFPLVPDRVQDANVVPKKMKDAPICTIVDNNFLPCSGTTTKGSTTSPVAATIFFGANDAALSGRISERQHVPVEEYKENLQKIIQHFKNYSPHILLVLITPPPVDEQGRYDYARSLYGDNARELPERTNEVAGIYAKHCVELAEENNLASINLWSKMQEVEGWQKKFLSDGLHLTVQGNAIVFQEVARVLADGGLSPSTMQSDAPHHSEIDGENPAKRLTSLYS